VVSAMYVWWFGNAARNACASAVGAPGIWMQV
jgi:hypothetical protein